MSAPRDPDLIVAGWLDDGPEVLPTTTRRAISTAVRTTPQTRAGLGLPAWRPTDMSRLMALAGVAAVIAVAIGALAFYTPGPTGIVGATPLPPPRVTPLTPTPAPSQGISTAGWQPFTSTRYGYTVEFPAGWVATPASRDWSLDVDREAWDGPASDHFLGQSGGQTVLLTAFSVGVLNATALSDWVSAYLDPGTRGTCTVSTPAPISIDGHAGLITDTTCGDSEAFVLVNDRVYAFSVWRSGERRLLETFVSTARITALDSSTWPTYTSTRYVFGNERTIGHPVDWTVVPSDHDWTFDADGRNFVSSAHEAFVDPANDVRVSAWAVPSGANEGYGGWRDVETWVQAYCERTGNTPCTGIHERAVPLCLEQRDCHPGLLVPFQDDVQAFFTNGGEGTPMVVIAVWRGQGDPTTAAYGGSANLLEAFLSTMDVQPAEDSPFVESHEAAASFRASAP
jgi:hypothetical protein